MGVFGRSWSLTKTTFDIIRKDSEMLLFPVLAGIASTVYAVALVVPSVLIPMSRGVAQEGQELLLSVVSFGIYLGLAFIATFFNVCVVYTTRVRLEGGDATFMQSLSFAASRAHQILMWSLLSATVGLLLTMLHNSARRAGALGKLLLHLLHRVLASAWAITTIFVVPAMVYKGFGPIDALKESMRTVKNTWGENLVRHYGMGVIQALALLLPIALIVGGALLADSAPRVALTAVGVGFLVLIAQVVVFQMANTVFTTALYHWAVHQTPPPGFAAEQLSGAFGVKR